MSDLSGLTRLLQAMRAGDRCAASQLWRLVYAELHGVAVKMMHGERLGHTLQPTAVVNEAYIRLVGGAQPAPENRAQFFAFAARAMRQVLVDHARRKLAGKRGGARYKREEFDEEIALTIQQSEELLAIHEALEQLEKLDNQQAQIVEMHYFSGNSVDEIAMAFDISERGVKRELQTARLFLKRQLESKGMALP